MKTFLKILLNAVITLVVVAGAFYIAFSYSERARTLTPSETGLDGVIENDLKKIKLQNALIDSIAEKKELITQEVELSETVKWDESWGTLGAFRKSQSVRFYATGIYICDLNRISPDDIIVSLNSKKLTVAISSPEIKSVTINEEKTEYEDVSKGWLRFGGVKLTQQQYALIYHCVKEAMCERLNDPEIVKKAEESSKKAVKELFEDILNAADENYIVDVYIKEA